MQACFLKQVFALIRVGEKMSHYFQNDDSLKSEKRLIKYTINSKQFELISDLGVFSKNELDPGSKLLIQNAIKHNIHGSLLDMGCGYGPIGITLFSLCPIIVVDFVDVNKRALALTKENAIKYNLQNFDIFESNGFENVENTYDYILINPPIRAGKEVIFNMFENSIKHLNEDGILMIVIRKDQGAPSAKNKLQSIFGNCETIDREKGYHILVCKKSKEI